MVTHAVAEAEKAEGALADSQRCGFLEELIPTQWLSLLLEWKLREKLVLEHGIPEQTVELVMRYASVGVDRASVADKRAESVMLVCHSFTIDRGEFGRPARRPPGPLEIVPDRFPEGVELACRLIPQLGSDLRVRRADDSFAEARVQVLGTEAEEHVVRRPDLAGRVEELLLDRRMSPKVSWIWLVAAVDSMTPVNGRDSEWAHDAILSPSCLCEESVAGGPPLGADEEGSIFLA
jgi:hypothetical protein